MVGQRWSSKFSILISLTRKMTCLYFSFLLWVQFSMHYWKHPNIISYKTRCESLQSIIHYALVLCICGSRFIFYKPLESRKRRTIITEAKVSIKVLQNVHILHVVSKTIKLLIYIFTKCSILRSMNTPYYANLTKVLQKLHLWTKCRYFLQIWLNNMKFQIYFIQTGKNDIFSNIRYQFLWYSLFFVLLVFGVNAISQSLAV